MSRGSTVVNAAGRVVDRLAPAGGITILLYHRVGGGSDSAVDLDPDTFDRQLAHLAEHHRVLTLDDAVAELAGAQPSGWAASRASTTRSAASDAEADGSDRRPPVVITFDDGTTDVVEVAVPLLERHGLPATLYLATSFVEHQEPFPWGAPPATWSALREATASGHLAVESHTHRHLLLDRVGRDTVVEELDRSIELIGERLGRPPTHFAYPKAVPGSPTAEVEVRRRFASASLARNRANRPGSTDLHRLWRTPVRRDDDVEMFARRARGGTRLEGELRSLAVPLRYRGLDA